MRFVTAGIFIISIIFLNGCVTINLNDGPSPIETAPVCGNNICEDNEIIISCPQDCGGQNQGCGNSVCEAGENPENCSADCGTGTVQEILCGNSVCETGESNANCPQDCEFIVPDCGNDCGEIEIVCGNNECESGEDFNSCPQDCSFIDTLGNVCGNNECESGETSETCAQDCSVIEEDVSGCGNGVCENSETLASCQQDCAFTADVLDQFPTITLSASPSNPSQSLTFDLTITVEDNIGIDTLVWETEQFIPFHVHSNSFDCGLQTTCTNTWEELITVEEGVIQIVAFATDSSGQVSRGDIEITVLPFVPYEVEVGPVCGNDVCQEGETVTNCSQDCLVIETISSNCGNNTCENGETSLNCSQDCQIFSLPVCGDGTCEGTESMFSCPADCAIPEPEPEEESCNTRFSCGYKQDCKAGKCVDVKCIWNSHCGFEEQCNSSNRCESCPVGALGVAACS